MVKSLAENRRALFGFKIKKKIEAGIKLTGAEVKSVRRGKVDLTGSFIKVLGGEAYAVGMRIAPYPPAAEKDYDPRRTRKVLLKKQEINSLAGILSQKGFSAIPLRIYLRNNLIKLEVGFGRGKRKVDRRAQLKEREARREIERALKGY